MILRVNEVWKAAQLPPEERTEEMIEDIAAFCNKVPFIQILHEKQRRILARHMTVETFSIGETIFKYGDEGDKCYIVLSGCVSINIPSKKLCLEHFECDCVRPDIVGFCCRGEAFGERALQQLVPRAASIVCVDDVKTLVINKKNFQTYCLAFHREYVENQVSYLKIALDSKPPPALNDLITIASFMVDRTYTKAHVVCVQGHMAERVILVRKGSLSVVRKVGELSLNVGQMNPYTHYGAYETSRRRVNAVSLFVNPFCTFYTLERSVLTLLMASQFEKSGNTLCIPSDKKLLQLYEMRRRWQRYKKELVKCVAHKGSTMARLPDSDMAHFSDLDVTALMKLQRESPVGEWKEAAHHTKWCDDIAKFPPPFPPSPFKLSPQT